MAHTQKCAKTGVGASSCNFVKRSKVKKFSVKMAKRQPQKRKPPTHFNDFEAVELINDYEADLTDVDLDE